ncbi:MAG: glycosyltransferase involved in cell wall biosynthesis [Colwellia sp.]
MSSAIVSVIIPAYNAAIFIEGCISSVLNQTFNDLEIIIINDGSTDSTLELAEQFAAKDDRVSIISIKNCGRAAARNRGIQAAKGDWLAFLDADDLWTKQKIEKQLHIAYEKKADLIYTERSWIDENSTPLVQPKKYELPSGLIFDKLVEGNYICTSTVLVKKNIVLDEGCFSELATFKNAQDYQLWLRLSHNFIFQALEEELCLYRIHNDNAHKQIRNRFIGLRGCIETMKFGSKKYDCKTSITINEKIKERELEIAQNFARGLFHAHAYVECLTALETISFYSTLTIKQKVFQIISYIKVMINRND